MISNPDPKEKNITDNNPLETAIQDACVDYAWNSEQLLLALVKREGTILDLNRSFRQYFHISQNTGSRNIFDYLIVDGPACPTLIGGSGDMKGMPTMLLSAQIHEPMLFRVYEVEDDFLLLGINERISDDRQASMLSELTIEMGNLVRAVRHANRELLRANKRVSELARTDVLTGLFNRRYFDERLGQMIYHACRYREPLSVVMLDIDFFKSVNDNFGHQAGDDVLTYLGKVLSELKRESDLAARYGGEEFIIVLPDTDAESAFKFAQRIRRNIEEAHPLAGRELTVTVSLGVAELQDGDEFDTILTRVDNALYQAKESGRNQVCVAPQALSP